VDMLDGELPTT